jgi:O-antigen/teichoic acid export membrane protein
VMVLGKPVLSLLFGEQFTRAYPAVILLALGQFVNSISGSTGIFLNMTGHERALQNIMLAAAGLNIALALVLIPRFGVEGAAFASMLTTVSWNVVALVYIKAIFGRTFGYVPLLTRN